MEDGGEKYNQELHQFLLGLTEMSVIVHGSIIPTQQALRFRLEKGMTIHEAVIEEYQYLRLKIMG